MLDSLLLSCHLSVNASEKCNHHGVTILIIDALRSCNNCSITTISVTRLDRHVLELLLRVLYIDLVPAELAGYPLLALESR